MKAKAQSHEEKKQGRWQTWETPLDGKFGKGLIAGGVVLALAMTASYVMEDRPPAWVEVSEDREIMQEYEDLGLGVVFYPQWGSASSYVEGRESLLDHYPLTWSRELNQYVDQCSVAYEINLFLDEDRLMDRVLWKGIEPSPKGNNVYLGVQLVYGQEYEVVRCEPNIQGGYDVVRNVEM